LADIKRRWLIFLTPSGERIEELTAEVGQRILERGQAALPLSHFG